MQPIVPQDATAIAELEEDLFPDNCFNSKTLEKEILAGLGTVHYDSNVLVGYWFGRNGNGLTDILRLGVRESHQGQGLGKALLCHATGPTGKYMLTVRKDNEAAIKLYLKHEFRIIADTGESWILHLD